MDSFLQFFHKKSSKLKGMYLAVVLEPVDLLKEISKKVREQHGFMPMEMAIPPREKDSFHTTIAFFMSGITEEDLEALRTRFAGREVGLTVTGHGKAVKEDNQALYFSIDPKPVEELRDEVRSMGLTFNQTDPHITFGVHVDTRKDAHGVPKQKQIDVEPFTVRGKVSLRLGKTAIF